MKQYKKAAKKLAYIILYDIITANLDVDTGFETPEKTQKSNGEIDDVMRIIQEFILEYAHYMHDNDKKFRQMYRAYKQMNISEANEFLSGSEGRRYVNLVLNHDIMFRWFKILKTANISEYSDVIEELWVSLPPVNTPE